MNSNKFPLNPKLEIFRWGPVPGRYFYVSDFAEAMFEVFPKLYKGYKWPDTLFLFKDNRILWINEFPQLRTDGSRVFMSFMLPATARQKLWIQWKNVLKRLHKLERKFDSTDLTSLDDKYFYQLSKDFYSVLIDLWISTIPAELGNYGSDYLLEQKLQPLVKNEQERREILEILTAPEQPSFYQQEEIALSETQDIPAHQREYFWLQNSYNGTKILTTKFFTNRKRKMPRDLKIQVSKHLKSVKKKKIEIVKKYKLPKVVVNIAKALTFGVEWQDMRKGEIFRYLHYKELYLNEIARRKKLQVDQLKNLGTLQLVEGIYKASFLKSLVKRKKPFGFFCRAGKVVELSAKQTQKYWSIFGEEKVVKNDRHEVGGIVASRGKKSIVTAKARIVLDPFNYRQFKKGDVLIAPMTSPEYIFLMKKAVAIITDAGGLTSHAAIVSRELKVPCIVGTKFATKVFKDGDMVEVDATKGTVKIIT